MKSEQLSLLDYKDAGAGGNKNIAQNGLATQKPAGPGRVKRYMPTQTFFKPDANLTKDDQWKIILKTGKYICRECGADTGIGRLHRGFVYCRKCYRKLKGENRKW